MGRRTPRTGRNMIRYLKRELAEYRFRRAVDAMMRHGESHCGGDGACPYFDGLAQIMNATHETLLRLGPA